MRNLVVTVIVGLIALMSMYLIEKSPLEPSYMVHDLSSVNPETLLIRESDLLTTVVGWKSEKYEKYVEPVQIYNSSRMLGVPPHLEGSATASFIVAGKQPANSLRVNVFQTVNVTSAIFEFESVYRKRPSFREWATREIINVGEENAAFITNNGRCGLFTLAFRRSNIIAVIQEDLRMLDNCSNETSVKSELLRYARIVDEKIIKVRG